MGDADGMTDVAPSRFVARRPSPVVTNASGPPLADRSHLDDATMSPVDLSAYSGAVSPAVIPGRARIADEFGPLLEYAIDPAVTDIFVNGTGPVWVDRGGGLRPEAPLGLDEPSLRAFATRLIAAGGRHVDETTPCVDVRLHDGIRIHAVLPPVSPRGTLLSIRLPRVERFDLDALARHDFFADVPLALVRDLIAERRNILLSGAGGSGKTTLLSTMLSAAPREDRIVAIEDVAELRVDHPHFVSLEARQPNLEGAGAIELPRLVREALRMRPDRLVLGECRGAEIRELLSALNTGHDGGAGTLHANSIADVPARLEALGALAGLDPPSIARQAVSAIQVVLHLERRGGERRLAEVGRLALENDRLVVVPLDAPTARGRRRAVT